MPRRGWDLQVLLRPQQWPLLFLPQHVLLFLLQYVLLFLLQHVFLFLLQNVFLFLLQHVLLFLLQQGVGVLWYREVPLDLEHVYMKLTTQAKAGKRRGDDAE